ncbi:MAG: molybdenum cofactor guanylyltransferase [Acetobacter sp.]|uniref:molybdenum cofactor guanylyltransferase n=1 Tax=Acetobacter sp. TaxID=440 RepID=UPI003D054730
MNAGSSSMQGMRAPLFGLVLTGGLSQRMGTDKAALPYAGRPQLVRAFTLLSVRVASCFVSLRPVQRHDPLRRQYPVIVDTLENCGPTAGLVAAHTAYPDVAWLVLACDMPLMDGASLDALIAARDPRCHAVAFRSAYDGLPEPLCTIWEPAALALLCQQVTAGALSPRKVLAGETTRVLSACNPAVLNNVNTGEERERAVEMMKNRRDGVRGE